MKYRTIEEAKLVQIPNFPKEIYEKYTPLAIFVKSGNANAVSKLSKIYALTDSITAFIASYMVCEKGCSHCCKIDVSVTSVEAQYINKNLGVVPDPGNAGSNMKCNA